MRGLIESILKRHNGRCHEEVREKEDKHQSPNDSEVEIVPHERHGVLLTHHSNDLLLQSSH